MNTAVRKILGDLRERPGRSALVGAATALAAALVVGSFAASSVLTREIDASFLRSRPPHVVLVRPDASDQDQRTVASHDGVSAVSRRRMVRGRLRSETSEWHTLVLFITPSLRDMTVSAVTPLGRVPGSGEVLVERSSLRLLPLSAGAAIQMRFSDRREISTIVGGFAHDGGVAPGWQDRVVYAYADAQTVSAWGMDASFDELRVLAAPAQDPRSLGRELGQLLASTGAAPTRIEVPARVHPHADQMGAVLALIGAFAAMGLVIGSTLTATMMLAMVRGQTRQVGVMKAIGASRLRLTLMFVGAAAALAVPAVAIGVVPGLLAARAFVAFAASELNLDGVNLAPTFWPVASAVSLSCLAPVAAAFVICRRAARQTVLEAIHDEHIVQARSEGVSGSNRVGTVWISYARRNVWRQPARAVLTAVALTLGGATLMTATHVYRSLVAAVERSFSFRHDDADLRLAQPADATRLRSAIAKVPGVRDLELWGGGLAVLSYGDGTSSGRYGLLAPPLGTKLLNLPVSEGHWLTAATRPEAVLTRNLLAKEPSLAPGRDVTIVFQGQSLRATLVGIVDEVSEPAIYINASAHRQLVSGRDVAGVLRLRTVGAPDQAIRAMDDALFDAGVMPAFVFDRDSLRRSTSDHFVILLVILGVIAACALVVGGLGLATSTSITMVERRREMGVLKSIGATNRSILRLCAVEAGVVVVVAMAAAVLVALGMSWALEQVLARQALHIAIPFTVSVGGIVGWLALALLIGILAVWFPVNASLRMPARDALVLE